MASWKYVLEKVFQLQDRETIVFQLEDDYLFFDSMIRVFVFFVFFCFFLFFCFLFFVFCIFFIIIL